MMDLRDLYIINFISKVFFGFFLLLNFLIIIMINWYIIYDDFIIKYLCRSIVKFFFNMGFNSEILVFDVRFLIVGLLFYFECCFMYLVKLVSISVVCY